MLIILQINIDRSILMSYFYTVYNCYNPFTQSFSPFIAQYSVQKQIQTHKILHITSQVQPSLKTTEKFQPILISQTLTSASLPSKDKITKKKKEIKKKKDQNFGWRNQNKDRNIISNILKSYVFSIVHGKSMTKQIEQASKIYQIQNGVSSFYNFLGINFPPQKSYVGLSFMAEVLRMNETESREVAVLRKTLFHYLKNVFPLFVCQNDKLRKKDKLSQLKKAREILNVLFNK